MDRTPLGRFISWILLDISGRGELAVISTGSKAIDSLLGGGIRGGMITDVYGESGSGKTQLCFTASSNCVKDGGKVVFLDTAGTFRPERVVEIASTHEVLDSITFVRALNTIDQANAVQKIREIDPQLVIVDTLTGLFSAEYSGPARHLAVMKHLHDLAVCAIDSGSATLVTNMVRSVPAEDLDRPGPIESRPAVAFEQREYLGSSVSIYSHMKLKLEIVDAERSIFRATLVQPPGKEPALFTVSSTGITDVSGP
ncbi:MAG: hypothetical protein ACREBU_07045 [Nitrososphaera sp.]